MKELLAVGETDMASQVAACAQYLLDGDFGTPQQAGDEEYSIHRPAWTQLEICQERFLPESQNSAKIGVRRDHPHSCGQRRG